MTLLQQSRIRAIEDLRGPAGKLEALLNTGSEDARYAALICHPHPSGGGTMHNKVIYHAMKVFASFGIPVLRFNFRGTGLSHGEHDGGHGEQQDARSALNWLQQEYGLPILFAGFSFGAYVGLRACCGDPRVDALIALGLPITSAGRNYDYSFLPQCTAPKLFISGDHDEFAPAAMLDSIWSNAPAPARTVWIPGADHFFQGTPSSPGAKLCLLQAEMTAWLQENLKL